MVSSMLLMKGCEGRIVFFSPNRMVKSALFVCLGNTCRSPIAQAVFSSILKERGIEAEWKVDSAGLRDWHSGSRPNSRARATLLKHNIDNNERARQIEDGDFLIFDYIFGMDEYNIEDLKGRLPENCKAKILLLGDFDPQGDRIIEDPYCDIGLEGFEKCYQQCVRACNGFLESLE